VSRKTPLIPPGSVLLPRESAPESSSVLDDVLSTHRRRKGLSAPEEADPGASASLQESQNVRKNESQNETKNEINQESLKERKNEGDDLLQQAVLCSARPEGELIPWGTRLPRALKKRLDFQAFRLKERRVSGQGLTILALERLLSELEKQDS
jgi:hypothetical protein